MNNIKNFDKFINEELNNENYNGIIYFSELNSEDYYYIYILDNSDRYLNDLKINSIGSIKEDSMYISDIFTSLFNIQVPYSDTELELPVMSYGFKVDGKISENMIADFIIELKRSNLNFDVLNITKH